MDFPVAGVDMGIHRHINGLPFGQVHGFGKAGTPTEESPHDQDPENEYERPANDHPRAA